MKFEIESEIITKVVGMIMDSNEKNHEVAMKVLDKTLDIADKFLDAAMQSMAASEKRSQIRFEQEQADRKARLAAAVAEQAEREAQYAEAAEERKLAAARRDKEWEELNSSKKNKS
jgi:hypothetical protein